MCRRATAHAEIVWRLHQPSAEVPLPDAIYHDPGCQWVFCISDPFRQKFAPASFMAARHLLCAKDRQESSWDLIAQISRIPLAMDPSVGRQSFDDCICFWHFSVLSVKFRDARFDPLAPRTAILE